MRPHISERYQDSPATSGSRALRATALSLVLVVLSASSPSAGQTVQRILEQDPNINNLVDPPGYEPAAPGALGGVIEVGHGPQTMILIPGLGFGADVYESFMVGREDAYTMYAVTLAGFGGTAAPPTPPESTSFGEQTWTAAAVAALAQLVEARDLRDVVVVGHWMGGTQVALGLARAQPDRVAALVWLAGSARFVASPPNPQMPDDRPLDQRIAAIDRFLAPRWFKTVTRETWDDNNFLPGDYAVNPVIGLRLWRKAASPPLHVWVRYLCEFYAQDSTIDLEELAVPTLLLRPGLEGVYHDPDNHYLQAYSARSWGRFLEGNGQLEVRVIANTRLVMWEDQPEAVAAAVGEFLRRRLQ